MSEPQNPKTEEAEVVREVTAPTVDTVLALPQNQPKIAEAPTGQSAQIGVNEPNASAETVKTDSARTEMISESVTPEPRSSETAGEGIITPVVVSALPPENKRNFALSLLRQAREKLQWRKRKKLDRILAEIAKKGKIRNDEVEKLLHVGDATATRYFSQLLKEQKIKTNGQKGKALFYTLK